MSVRYPPPRLGPGCRGLGGTAGWLARDNARRNPQRTASTAAALMIGLALVTLVALLAAGITASFRGAVNKIWTNADYAITAQNNFDPIPIAAANAVAKAPGVEAVANVRTGDARAFGKNFFATAVNPPGGSMFQLEWKEGSQAVFSQLGADGAFIDDGYAKRHQLHLGSPIDMTFSSGAHKTFFVRGIFNPPTGGSPFGTVTISQTAWDKLNENPENLYSFVRMRGGDTPQNAATLDRALKRFPDAKEATRQKFIDNQISGLKSILNIFYVLLALSVIVSLFGIVNTLVLTVFERTREIGMLRAIGMTRRQVRRMIRHESVITALIGGTLGIALGIVLGGAPRRARRLHRLLAAHLLVARLRGRGDLRRDPGGDLPGAQGGAAERARGTPVRVTGDVKKLLRAYVASDDREEADRCAMLQLAAELEHPTSRDQERAHFTASAFVSTSSVSACASSRTRSSAGCSSQAGMSSRPTARSRRRRFARRSRRRIWRSTSTRRRLSRSTSTSTRYRNAPASPRTSISTSGTCSSDAAIRATARRGTRSARAATSPWIAWRGRFERSPRSGRTRGRPRRTPRAPGRDAGARALPTSGRGPARFLRERPGTRSR